jgi:hypothetical protein
MLMTQEMADKDYRRSNGAPTVEFADSTCAMFPSAPHRMSSGLFFPIALKRRLASMVNWKPTEMEEDPSSPKRGHQ